MKQLELVQSSMPMDQPRTIDPPTSLMAEKRHRNAHLNIRIEGDVA